MAESLAHRWGQIIGDVFEMFVREILVDVANRHDLYLDFKRPRKARQGRHKVTWPDGLGNKHDLDYVMERGGTEEARLLTSLKKSAATRWAKARSDRRVLRSKFASTRARESMRASPRAPRPFRFSAASHKTRRRCKPLREEGPPALSYLPGETCPANSEQFQTTKEIVKAKREAGG